MRHRLLKLGYTLFVLASITLSPEAAWCADIPVTVVKAGRVFVGNGQVVDRGAVLIRNGRIVAVGTDIELPPGGQVIDVGDNSLTPGLIDANARIESTDLIQATRKQMASPTTGDSPVDAQRFLAQFQPDRPADSKIQIDDRRIDNRLMAGDGDGLPMISGVRPRAVVAEQSSEVVPYLNLVDTLDLRSRDWMRLAAGGVTTVYVSPDASAVIGPRGTVVHTAGRRDRRILVSSAAVKVTIGSDTWSLGSYNRPPSRRSASLYARRPNSRMGLIWILRKGFADAQRRTLGLPVYGADTASPEALAVLWDVRQRKVPLRIQARIQQDILAALRVADEFDLQFTLEEATEAYRCIDELKAASVPVIFGPIYERPSGLRESTNEAKRSRYDTLRALLDAEIPTALSAQEMRDEGGLARQAMYAGRFGVSFDDALKAVTATPAQFLGCADQIGTLENGKRADMVVWSGQPFAATSRIELVMIDGTIVFDRR